MKTNGLGVDLVDLELFICVWNAVKEYMLRSLNGGILANKSKYRQGRLSVIVCYKHGS